MSGYANMQALVSTDWVEAHLGNGIRVVEVDEDTEAYRWGHIPGAVALNWRTEMQDRVKRDLADPEAFARLLAARGVSPADTVVLYGGNNNWFAAYAYWVFKLYGHPDVRLMDGGRKKWELEERPLDDATPVATATEYPTPTTDHSIRVFRDDVVSAIGSVPMIDVRSADEFSGKLAAPPHLPGEQAQKKGHIPGARNVPWSRAAREDGSFKDLEELQKLYLGEAGLRQDGPAITYCRIGERSSHTWFVLHELLGMKDVRNYDGSWTEYGSLVGVPIERTHADED